MSQLVKGVVLLVLVVPVTAYVATSLATPDLPGPGDHSPVILRDGPSSSDSSPTTSPTPKPARRPTPTPTPGDRDGSGRDDAVVVTPQPTPIGEDEDDEWDDGDDSDDTTDDDGDDGGDG